jgi:2-oxoglutarate ferredoxin oxidoreductase subunit delta
MRFWRVPLDIDSVRIPRGTVRILVDRCKGCEFCVGFCPRDVLGMSDDFNAKGYHYPVVLEPGRCVDCDLCQTICPDFAIYCDPVDEAKAESREESEHAAC